STPAARDGAPRPCRAPVNRGREATLLPPVDEVDTFSGAGFTTRQPCRDPAAAYGRGGMKIEGVKPGSDPAGSPAIGILAGRRAGGAPPAGASIRFAWSGQGCPWRGISPQARSRVGRTTTSTRRRAHSTRHARP